MGLLSLCRKAGQLKCGFDAVAASLGRDAALVLFAGDASPKTIERMQFKARRQGVPSRVLPYGSGELERVLGRRLAVLAITDRGLADRVASLTEQKEES